MFKITLYYVLFLIIFPFSTLLAEELSGKIIQESSRGGHSIAYVKINICNNECFSTYSTNNGKYYFRNIPPGRYRVSAEIGGTEYSPQPRIIEVHRGKSNFYKLILPR
ncbi:MAG: carboxypeptidase-like regulatory domain-containing protein [Desulfovermiculus sp.]